jgi:glutamate formiminotransferase
MTETIECVPNVSEGRRPDILDQIADAVSDVPGALLLDRSSDRDHNRTVLTLAGNRAGLKEAIRRLYAVCLARIDLTAQRGAHPRMGAVDVVPFIPISGADMTDCIALSREVGAAVAAEFGVPVYLYAESATREARRLLPNIRKGGFEAMASKMGLPGWKPDFGPNAPHATAGVSAVGARRFLIAYNIQLDTTDIEIAKAVARAVRASSGGLPYLQAMGVFLADRNRAQVSMNLLNYEATGIALVQKHIIAEAALRGAKVAGAELVGLIPEAALADRAQWLVPIDNFADAMVVENAIAAAAESRRCS